MKITTHSLLQHNIVVDHGAVGGAPSLLRPLKPWNGSSPRATGKSPIADPGGSTPAAAVDEEPKRLSFFLKTKRSQIRRRSTDSGTGKSNEAASKNRQPDEGGSSTPEPRRAPPSRRRATPSKTDPPAPSPPRRRRPEDLSLPTLCTRRESAFPRPPAAGAAGGGRGSHRFSAGEVVRPGRSQIPLWVTVDERGRFM